MSFLSFSYPVTLLILCPLVFLAGFVDSVAGGGGLISLPAYIFAGIPIHICYGTNKFVNGCGTLCSSINYFRNKCVNVRAALCGAAGALVGSPLGARFALHLSPAALQVCLLVILPLVAAFMIFNRGVQTTGKRSPLKNKILMAGSFFTGLIIGCYDGFFGPGTGMFLTLILHVLLRLELITASGTTKIINLASNIGSAVTFLIAGKILFVIALPCLFCSIAGNYLGSHLAIKNGARIIRPLIAFAAVLLIVHVVSDFIKV